MVFTAFSSLMFEGNLQHKHYVGNDFLLKDFLKIFQIHKNNEPSAQSALFIFNGRLPIYSRQVARIYNI